MPAPLIDNERELLLLVAAGNEKAFHTLFDLYYDRIYRVALLLTKSAVLSEEIVQDVFLKIWIGRGQLSDIVKFENYLFVVAKHRIYNELRKKIVELPFAEFPVQCSGLAGPLADDVVRLKETNRLINHAVQKLPVQQRAVYQLSRVAGLDQSRIAKELQISKLTVKSHMTKALHSIRQYLQMHSYLLLFGCITMLSI